MDVMYAQLYSVIGRGFDTEKDGVGDVVAASQHVGGSQMLMQIEEQELNDISMSANAEPPGVEPAMASYHQSIAVNRSVKSTPMLSNPM